MDTAFVPIVFFLAGSLSPLIAAQDDDTPLYTIKDDNGEDCLRATVRAALSIRYLTQGLDRTKILQNDLYMPTNLTTSGECGTNQATLKFSWLDGNYTLSFTFKSNETRQSSNESSLTAWFASSIQLEFASGLGTEYPTIKKDGMHIVQSPKGQLYLVAPQNFSYRCDSQEDITLQEYNNGSVDTTTIEAVALGIYQVQVQVGGFYGNNSFGQEVRCLADLRFGVSHQRMVTVAVAAVLASIILVIVVTHAVLKSRTKLRYASME